MTYTSALFDSIDRPPAKKAAATRSGSEADLSESVPRSSSEAEPSGSAPRSSSEAEPSGSAQDSRHVLVHLTPYVAEPDPTKQFRLFWSRSPIEVTLACLKRAGVTAAKAVAFLEGGSVALGASLDPKTFLYPIHDPAPLVIFADGVSLDELAGALDQLRSLEP